MKTNNLISAKTICLEYNIEFSFVHALHQMGRIHIEIIEEDHFIPEEQLSDLEKMVRLNQDLNVNLEGIDVVLNLLEKEKALQEELNTLRNRLRFYEGV